MVYTTDQSRTIAAAIRGDARAFEWIVLEYQARLARYIERVVHDPDLALDLTQDAFVNAFRNIKKLRSAEALSGWLFKIATNLAFQACAHKRRLDCSSLNAVAEAAIGAVEAPDSMIMDRELVEIALAQLPPDRVACLLLHIKEGFNYDEVAIIMNSTPEAVRKRIARAKQQFREVYDQAIVGGRARYAVR